MAVVIIGHRRARVRRLALDLTLSEGRRPAGALTGEDSYVR